MDKQGRRIAVQFGAGNIGRGFLGQLYHESGYHTIFVDVAPDLVSALNERGGYTIRIVDEQPADIHVGNISAIDGRDVSAVTEALSTADIAATAVGVHVMDKIAASLATGVARRFKGPDAPPLDIIICENMIGAGPFMREKVRENLPFTLHATLDAKVGFVEASIGRMVPVMTEEAGAQDPLLIQVEAYCELPVDAAAFRGPIPPLKNLQPKDRFEAYVERKIFVHNAGHAASAYLGYLKGYEFIWQAVEDPGIRQQVAGAMDESCHALAARHGISLAELQGHAQDLLRRFGNRALGDQIARVAKDPIRKLGPNDRLVGAANLCLEQGVEPTCLCQAIAAALQYDNPNDAASVQLQNLRHEQGDAVTLADISGINDTSQFWPLIQAGL